MPVNPILALALSDDFSLKVISRSISSSSTGTTFGLNDVGSK